MTAVEPISRMPQYIERYVNASAPAGLVALSRKSPISNSPEQSMGSALLTDPLIWRMYDAGGKLVSLRAGTTFLAKV